MATIGNTYLNLADWQKRQDPDGTMAPIIDLLSQSNQMMPDIPWMEGNLPTGHKTTVRTGIPSGTWRQLYQGVTPTKSTTAEVTEACGNLEAYSEIDKDLAELNGNTAAFRLGEDAGFLEGMSQQMQAAYVYSNAISTPSQIMGLSPRYSSLTGANTGANIIDAGGTGSTNTSMWLIGWHPNTICGIFPRGSRAGLTQTDLGLETKTNSDGSLLRVYRTHFQWRVGLAVRDWRYAVRICNIDVTLLSGGSAANLINALVSACHRVPVAPNGARIQTMPTDPSGIVTMSPRWGIYANRVVCSALDRQAMNKTNVLLNMGEWDGHPVTMFRGIPIRPVDQLLSTEARIT